MTASLPPDDAGPGFDAGQAVQWALPGLVSVSCGLLALGQLGGWLSVACGLPRGTRSSATRRLADPAAQAE